ncbi:MAG TPA: transposase [Blastocatellia bacterium]|nr:transposase [Blastocatellia bacterium]
MKYATENAEEFIRRFLQHVLPERFVKVRYYGLLAAGNRQLLYKARQLLRTIGEQHSKQTLTLAADREAMRCPNCGSEMIAGATLKARGRGPP